MLRTQLRLQRLPCHGSARELMSLRHSSRCVQSNHTFQAHMSNVEDCPQSAVSLFALLLTKICWAAWDDTAT
jgi:hypothetical protein